MSVLSVLTVPEQSPAQCASVVCVLAPKGGHTQHTTVQPRSTQCVDQHTQHTEGPKATKAPAPEVNKACQYWHALAYCRAQAAPTPARRPTGHRRPAREPGTVLPADTHPALQSGRFRDPRESREWFECTSKIKL